MSSALNILLEMGFPQNKVERALSVTGNSGVEQAMEWLLAHADEFDDELPQAMEEVSQAVNEAPQVVDELPQTTSVPTETGTEDSKKEPETNSEAGVSAANENTEQMESARSLKCDECGKLMKSDEELEFHAAKTGHVNFSESTEEVKPLSEEEKRERVKMLEEKIKLRRMEKEAQERREQIEREKRRRRTGQEIIEAKKKLEEEDLKRIADQRRKEKMEDKLARQKILDQIERDKQARREKFAGPSQTSVAAPTIQTAPPPVVANTSQKKNYEETKIQIRLPTGQVLTQTFGSKEELAAVRLYIQMNQTEINTPFTLMTNFPKRIFNDEDMEKPLYELGLVPSAVLIISKQAV